MSDSPAELPLSQIDLIDTIERDYVWVDDPDRVQEAAIEFYDQLEGQISRLNDEDSSSITVVHKTDELAIISLYEILSESGFENIGVEDPELKRAVGCWMTLSTTTQMDYMHCGRIGYDSFIVPADWLDQPDS